MAAAADRRNSSNNNDSHIKIGKTLSDSDVLYLSNISGFTMQEIREWHVGFLKDCPSGNLNRKKFIEIYKQLFPGGKADKFSKHAFRAFDRDSSGSIDFGEFLLAISITAQPNPDKRLEWTFSMYDINHNGFIDKKEMRKILNAIYDLVGEEKTGPNSPAIKVDQIFSTMDCNGDGKLSKDEFVAGCLGDDYLRKLLAPSIQ